MDRASDSGSEVWGFESLPACHEINLFCLFGKRGLFQLYSPSASDIALRSTNICSLTQEDFYQAAGAFSTFHRKRFAGSAPDGIGAVDELYLSVHCIVEGGEGLIVFRCVQCRAKPREKIVKVAVNRFYQLVDSFFTEFLQPFGELHRAVAELQNAACQAGMLPFRR